MWAQNYGVLVRKVCQKPGADDDVKRIVPLPGNCCADRGGTRFLVTVNAY